MRKWLIVAAGLIVVVAVVLLMRKPAQIGTDEQAFREVDALFTAVTARRPDLVDQSDARLTALNAAGKLPDAARDELATVVSRAKAGRWESAAERLYDFMLAQDRSGVQKDRPPVAKKKR